MAINTETFFGRSTSTSTAQVTTGATVSSGARPDTDVQPTANPGNEEKKTILSELIQIDKDVKKIQKLIAKGRVLRKKEQENNKKQDENKKREEKELRLEKKKERNLPGIKPTPFPKMGFLDRIRQFLFYTLVGSAFVKFGKHIPEILKFTKLLVPAFEFFEKLTGNILNGIVDFIGAGYKAQDKIKEIAKTVGGENLEKKFDEFNKQFNTFANLAIIAGLAATGGGVDFGGGKRERLGVDKQTGRRVSKRSQARFLERYGEKAYVEKFGKRSFKGLTGKTAGRFTGKFAGKALGKIPIIGGLVDFIISTVIFKEKPGRAAAKALGATIGSTLGTFTGIPLAGTILGGIVGDLVGGALYDSLVGDGKLKAKAKGGQVTRGGRKVGGAVKRTIRKVRSKPPRTAPQKSIPGKDIGGKKQIEELFPTTTDPRQKNPLGVLETSSKEYKKIPLIGELMGSAIDSDMGQRIDNRVFKKFGIGLGYLIQNAIDSETTASISNIQRQIVGLAGGGMIPRTLSTNENVGMKIGERIAKTLQTMVNSKVSNTLQAIRQQLNRQDIYGGGVPGMGSRGGISGGGQIPGDAPPEVKAMLEAISAGEGGWDSVNPGTTVPGLNNMTITKAREAAIQKGVNQMGGSGAMGKWQQMPEFILDRARSAGLDPDRDKFSPENQTKIARMLMASVYPGGEAQLVKDARKDPMGAATKLRGTWPSLPGGSQANTTERQFRENYARSLQSYRSPQPSKLTSAAFSAVLPEGNPQITSGFGRRNIDWGSKDHKGIDIGVDRGSKVLALADGTVSIIPSFMHGSAVVVTHSDGTKTLYGHVDPTVKEGDRVKKGQVIAKVKFWPKGVAGAKYPDNTHLHLERHVDGTPIDPSGLLNSLKPKPKPDTRPPSPEPAKVRTKLTRQRWDPSESGLTKNLETGVWEKASIAPPPKQDIASGVVQKATYEIAGGFTFAVQPIILEKQVPTQIASGAPTIIDNTQSTPTTAALTIG